MPQRKGHAGIQKPGKPEKIFSGRLDALRESEERYRSLFDRMMDGVYRSTHEGRFIDVNLAMVKMFGYSSKEEMLEVDIKNDLYFAPEERGSHVLDTGQEEMDVYRMRRKDGSEIWVEDHGFYVHDELGNIIYHEGILRDITGRKQIEDTLAASEAELRALFASMHDVVLVIDRQGVYRKIAPTNPGLLVRPPEELLGGNLKDVFSAEKADEFLRVMQQVLETKQNKQIEYELRIDDRIVWFQTTISPLNADSTLWVAHDITGRRRSEEELRRAKDALETANLELQQSLEREKKLASTDGLTGLYNHRHLFELAGHEFQAAVRYRRPLTFLMFDMDDFKLVNDTLGHTAGDRVLALVAQTAVAQVRACDVVARYGGDEFIIMLPQADVQDALPIAERIRASIAAISIETDKEPILATLSIGIAEMRRNPPDENVERVIQRADKALYKAKLSGRNRTVIFGQDERLIHE